MKDSVTKWLNGTMSPREQLPIYLTSGVLC